VTGVFTSCTKSFPCPVCGDTDHCAVLKARRIVCCRNPLANDGEPRHDQNGRAYWVHRLDVAAGTLLAEVPDAPPIAPVETLHRVYEMYLMICRTLQGGLLPRHQESLLSRGLSLAAIEANLYASSPTEAQRQAAAFGLAQQFGPETCRLVPGLIDGKDGEPATVMGLPGLLVPVRDPEGRIVALKLRRDVPDAQGNRYLTLSSSSAGGPIAHRAVHFPTQARLDIREVRVTEGELKADVAQARTGINTVSLPGVGAWKQAVPALKAFERLINQGSLGGAIGTVLVAFDADARRKATVALCLKNLVDSLREAGYRVALEVWPEGAGKGLDDLLARGGAPERLTEAAVDEEIALCLRQAGVKTFREQLAAVAAGIEAAGNLMPLSENGEWLDLVLDADLDRPRDFLWFEAELERVLPKTVRFKHALKRLLRVAELERKADEADEQLADEGGLPTIETYDRTTIDVGRDALAALVAANEPPVLFNQGGKLIQLQEREGERVPAEVRLADMQHWLDKSARWVETKSKRPILVPAPPRIAQDLLAGGRDFTPFPELRGIVHTPLFDRNGNLVATPGYHREARLFYQLKGELNFSVPESPDVREVKAARDWVTEHMFQTLAFDSEAALAHAWALYLLPFVREMIEGPTPLHIINAPKEGTGKGLTNFVCTSPFVPGGPKVRTQPKTNEEWGKALLGYLEEGESHMFFDNASYSLDSGTLALCLTERVFANRRLGTNTSVAVPIRCVWSVTGNNVEVSPEIARRSVWIGLDANCEDPARRNYAVDLRQFVREHRSEAVSAALTCIRWWIKHGKPLWTGGTMGSYEQWVETMGGILMMLDIEGFLGNQQVALDEYNSEALGWRAFVSEWWARHGDQEVRARDLTELADVLPFWEEIDGARSSAIAFGRRLEKQRNLIFLGKKITARVVCNQKVYRLQVVEEGEHLRDVAERARGLAAAA
jgi:hypothetical protein